MKLILVRHGLPQRQELSDGRADPPLAQNGQAQAERVAKWLEGEAIDVIYSSPMNRARQTAEPYARLRGLPINEREGVVEYDRQSRSYVPMEELKREDPKAWQAFVSSGFDKGVDVHQFHATVVNSLEEIIAAHAGETVVIFCHGGVINMWAAHVLGITPRMFFEPYYTSIHRFLCASTGQRNVEALNEIAHLRGADLL